MAVFHTLLHKELCFKELKSFTCIEEESIEDISFAPLTNKTSHSFRAAINESNAHSTNGIVTENIWRIKERRDIDLYSWQN